MYNCAHLTLPNSIYFFPGQEEGHLILHLETGCCPTKDAIVEPSQGRSRVLFPSISYLSRQSYVLILPHT